MNTQTTNTTLDSLNLGFKQMAFEYVYLMNKTQEYIDFFENRHKLFGIPFDLFNVKQIIKDLKKDVKQLLIMRNRFQECSQCVSVTVELPYFHRPSTDQVFLPSHLKPVSKKEIELAFKMFVRLMLDLEPHPLFC